MKRLLHLLLLIASLTTTWAQPPERWQELSIPFAVHIVLAKPKVDGTLILPTPTAQAVPEFPLAMRAIPTMGGAHIGLTVEADGRVTNLRIVKESQKEFGEAAIAAANAWRFTPGRDGKGYRAIDLEYQVTFDLPLSEGSSLHSPWGNPPFPPMATLSLRVQQARNEAARAIFDAVVVKKLTIGDTLENAKAILRSAGLDVDLKQSLLSVFHSNYQTGKGCGFSIYLDFDGNNRVTKIDIKEFVSGP